MANFFQLLKHKLMIWIAPLRTLKTEKKFEMISLTFVHYVFVSDLQVLFQFSLQDFEFSP